MRHDRGGGDRERGQQYQYRGEFRDESGRYAKQKGGVAAKGQKHVESKAGGLHAKEISHAEREGARVGGVSEGGGEHRMNRAQRRALARAQAQERGEEKKGKEGGEEEERSDEDRDREERGDRGDRGDRARVTDEDIRTRDKLLDELDISHPGREIVPLAGGVNVDVSSGAVLVGLGRAKREDKTEEGQLEQEGWEKVGGARAGDVTDRLPKDALGGEVEKDRREVERNNNDITTTKSAKSSAKFSDIVSNKKDINDKNVSGSVDEKRRQREEGRGLHAKGGVMPA